MKSLGRLGSGSDIAVMRVIHGVCSDYHRIRELTSGLQRASATMVKNQIRFPTVMDASITALERVGGVLL